MSMGNLSFDNAQALNETLARCFGFKKASFDDDGCEVDIWTCSQGEAFLNYPIHSFHPPQFSRGWKMLKWLVRGMEMIGYKNCTFRRFGSGSWKAEFWCSIGPCELHGHTQFLQHGGIAYGPTPGQAALGAALRAIGTGTKVSIPYNPGGTGTNYDVVELSSLEWKNVQSILDLYFCLN